jgi:hypothetical protein
VWSHWRATVVVVVPGEGGRVVRDDVEVLVAMAQTRLRAAV